MDKLLTERIPSYLSASRHAAGVVTSDGAVAGRRYPSGAEAPKLIRTSVSQKFGSAEAEVASSCCQQ